MPLLSFIILFFIALLFASLLSYGFKRSGFWGGFWGLLLILFLFAWAARLWIAPAGPVFFGFAWLPIAFVVFLFILLIAAATPEKKEAYRAPLTKGEDARTKEGLKGFAAAVSIFFWFLLITLIVAIIAGYLR
jgi:hypothetical protein